MNNLEVRGNGDYMRYINMEECFSNIQENRIDRKRGAYVYLLRNEKEIVLEFAYSEEKNEHFILSKMIFVSPNEMKEEIWQEYLALSMILETRYLVRRFVDDLRNLKEKKSV